VVRPRFRGVGLTAAAAGWHAAGAVA
jgi:hypothetical protein